MQYEVVTHDELEQLRSTLSLLERILEDHPLELFFYGISQNTALLAKANDALEEASEIGEGGGVKVQQVAVAIPLSSDSIHYLVGSGLILRDEFFAYVAGGDGVRTSGLSFSGHKARVTDEDFSEMAIADSDAWLDDFLVKHTANQEAAPAAPPVTRTESATAPPQPTEEGDESSNSIDEYLNQ